MRKLSIIIVGIFLYPMAAQSSEISFNKLTKCNRLRTYELSRDVDYALKESFEIGKCYQMDNRKEFLVIATSKKKNAEIGIYVNKNEKNLTVDDGIKYVVTQWEADNR